MTKDDEDPLAWLKIFGYYKGLATAGTVAGTVITTAAPVVIAAAPFVAAGVAGAAVVYGVCSILDEIFS
jgi:hypothetical protein